MKDDLDGFDTTPNAVREWVEQKFNTAMTNLDQTIESLELEPIYIVTYLNVKSLPLTRICADRLIGMIGPDAEMEKVK